MLIFNKFPNLTVIVSCFFWGSYWIPLRYIDSDSNGSLWPIFFSFLLLSLLLLKPLVKTFYVIFYERNYFFFLGCLFAATGITFYSESLLRGEIAKVVVLFYLCPIWGTIFAKIFLGNKLTLKRLLSIILGIIGLEIMVGIEKGIIFPTSVVEWIALSAGLSWALGMTLFHLAKSTSGFEKTALTALIIPFVFLALCLVPDGRTLEMPNQLISDLAWCLGPGGLCRPGGQHVRGYGDAHPTHRPGPASAPGAATVSGNGVGLRLHPDGRPVAHQAMAGSWWHPDHGLWHRGGGVGSWSGVCVFCRSPASFHWVSGRISREGPLPYSGSPRLYC